MSTAHHHVTPIKKHPIKKHPIKKLALAAVAVPVKKIALKKLAIKTLPLKALKAIKHKSIIPIPIIKPKITLVSKTIKVPQLSLTKAVWPVPNILSKKVWKKKLLIGK